MKQGMLPWEREAGWSDSSGAEDLAQLSEFVQSGIQGIQGIGVNILRSSNITGIKKSSQTLNDLSWNIFYNCSEIYLQKSIRAYIEIERDSFLPSSRPLSRPQSTA
jgi:hypothetical protein